MTVHQFASKYEFRGDGYDHVPTDSERAMVEDAIEGYLAQCMPAAPTVDAVAAAIMTVFIKKWFLGSYKGPIYLDCVNGEKAWRDEAKAAMAAMPGVAQTPGSVAQARAKLAPGPWKIEPHRDNPYNCHIVDANGQNVLVNCGRAFAEWIIAADAAPQRSPRLEREGIARLLFERKPTRHPQGLIPTWDKQPPNIRESYYGDADAILAMTVVPSTSRAEVGYVREFDTAEDLIAAAKRGDK